MIEKTGEPILKRRNNLSRRPIVTRTWSMMKARIRFIIPNRVYRLPGFVIVIMKMARSNAKLISEKEKKMARLLHYISLIPKRGDKYPKACSITEQALRME